MRVAIPICRGRISPVFDVAQSIRVVKIEERAVADHVDLVLQVDRARVLAKHGVNVVICAGISREMGTGLRAEGIELISGICGSVDEVVDAYIDGGLGDGRFFMPGGWLHRRGRRASGQETITEEWPPHWNPPNQSKLGPEDR